MMLQDVIRNIFLYKGIVKPFLKSWKEHLVTLSSSEFSFFEGSLVSLKLRRLLQNQVRVISESVSKHQLLQAAFNGSEGSFTIVTTKVILLHYFPSETIITIPNLGMNSSSNSIVLRGDSICDWTATVSKTENSQFVNNPSLTISFANEKVSSFLFHKTHEKREYLGEFSLPHEEAPLLYQKEGGE